MAKECKSPSRSVVHALRHGPGLFLAGGLRQCRERNETRRSGSAGTEQSVHRGGYRAAGSQGRHQQVGAKFRDISGGLCKGGAAEILFVNRKAGSSARRRRWLRSSIAGYQKRFKGDPVTVKIRLGSRLYFRM